MKEGKDLLPHQQRALSKEYQQHMRRWKKKEQKEGNKAKRMLLCIGRELFHVRTLF
jgi:hypothetical protein